MKSVNDLGFVKIYKNLLRFVKICLDLLTKIGNKLTGSCKKNIFEILWKTNQLKNYT